MTKVFVYGTLLSGQRNYEHFLNPLQPIESNAVLPGFAMYCLGGFPAIKPLEGSEIKGEVFEVDDETLARLDGLEGVTRKHPDNGFYNRVVATTASGVEVNVYTFRRADESPLIPSGDWREFERLRRIGWEKEAEKEEETEEVLEKE